MRTRVVILLVALATVAAVAGGCAAGGTGDIGGTPTAAPTSPPGTGTPGPTSVADRVEIDGNSLSIPAGALQGGRMFDFALTGDQGDKMTFMAYTSGGETYVRANICPPCRSVGFTLAGDVLVCDSCGTRFEAGTGEGITGGCRDYPKAAVDYTTSGDRLAMEVDDLVTAYVNTGKPGWP